MEQGQTVYKRDCYHLDHDHYGSTLYYYDRTLLENRSTIVSRAQETEGRKGPRKGTNNSTETYGQLATGFEGQSRHLAGNLGGREGQEANPRSPEVDLHMKLGKTKLGTS